MATPTRTVGPLHLEDLEPHRFEDMVRQLIYDFRNWRALEATGRSGSDDGFDARGFEIVGDDEESGEPNEGDETIEPAPRSTTDRIWLVQCKREKRISPKKLAGYLTGIPEGERANLYGIIFVGACDFSKTARDLFRVTIRELGFAEGYLWGKGEVEDMLFQPKNDHLKASRILKHDPSTSFHALLSRIVVEVRVTVVGSIANEDRLLLGEHPHRAYRFAKRSIVSNEGTKYSLKGPFKT